MVDSGGEGDVTAGHSCPETAAFSDIGLKPGEITINGQCLHVVQASAEEQAAIEELLGPAPPDAADLKPASNWRLAGAKLVGVLFLVATMGTGVGCGLVHHTAQCSQHGTGHCGHKSVPVKAAARRSQTGKRRYEDEANVELGAGNDQEAPHPASGHTLTRPVATLSTPKTHLIRPAAALSPSDAEKGNPMGEGRLPSAEKDLRPECEIRAEICTNRLPDGRCRVLNRTCRLFAGATDVGEMFSGVDRKLDVIHRDFREMREVPAPMPDDVARQVFALAKELEGDGRWRKAPIFRVFRLYCIECLPAVKVARKCGCSLSLVFMRLKQLRRKLGRDPAELRQMSSQFEQFEDSIRDSRARGIYRKGAVGDDDPDVPV